MANELWLHASPDVPTLVFTPDSGPGPITGIRTTDPTGRTDAYPVQIPASTTGGGAALNVTWPDGAAIELRGFLVPSQETEARFQCDDFHKPAPYGVAPPTPEPPQPQPPTSRDPLTRINQIYATGQFNLVNKEGCGLFTEAVCTDFHNYYGGQWGHIRKNPGQNQFNGHAVDAVQAVVGEHMGIWDII